MATNYPGALDTTANIIDNAVDLTATATTHAAQHNNVADAIIAVETALGINPKGSYADVKTWLQAAIVTNPSAQQKITPTADVVQFILKQGNAAYNSNLQEWHDSTDNIKAYVDKAGNFSAQSISINGSLIASTNLSDSGKLQRKGKIATNVATSTESMAVGWDIQQGVTPGPTTATPQNTLQVTASGSYTLSIHLGAAHIQGTDDVAQGLYGVVQNTAFSLTLTTLAPVTNPRWDAIVVQYNDSYYTGRTPADNFAFLQVVGNESASASLTGPNLTGAPGQSGGPALPASCVVLAYVFNTVGEGGVLSGNVLDQRILSGPVVWGEDNHKYRLGVDSTGNLFLGRVI